MWIRSQDKKDLINCKNLGIRKRLNEHVVVSISEYGKDGSNDLDNLMPTCRMCNFYKSTYSLDDFRKNLETLHERLQKTFIYRLALKYGLIEEHKKKVNFYFENEEEK